MAKWCYPSCYWCRRRARKRSPVQRWPRFFSLLFFLPHLLIAYRHVRRRRPGRPFGPARERAATNAALRRRWILVDGAPAVRVVLIMQTPLREPAAARLATAPRPSPPPAPGERPGPSTDSASHPKPPATTRPARRDRLARSVPWSRA